MITYCSKGQENVYCKECTPSLLEVREYHPSGGRDTCSLPATPHCLQNPKWPIGYPKIVDGVLINVFVFGRSCQFPLNKFIDPSTPSMRKGCDREKMGGGEGRKRMMIIVATTSLPAVNRPNVDRWNAVRSCQY